MAQYAQVIVDVPLDQPLDYRVDESLRDAIRAGQRCVVPLGRREAVGIVVGTSGSSAVDDARVREVRAALDEIPPLPVDWLDLTRFAADYYQHAWGEIALPALPRALRVKPGPRFAASLARMRRDPKLEAPGLAADDPELNDAQRAAAQSVTSARGFAPFLLFGVTGSGKTEVYLAAIRQVLTADPGAQVLLLVPEINLTPQFEARLRARFPATPLVSLHSGLPDAERAAAWLAAHEGRARLVLGTRLAVFASLPHLRLVVVDEEHDSSFKAGDGARYSARDLAVKRAQLAGAPIVLGSATPSLESWARALDGKYTLLRLPQRAGAGGARHAMPQVATVDVRRATLHAGLAEPLIEAVRATVTRGEQALIFINRRGYAPVIACDACGWLSQCPRCSVFAAFHKSDRALHCHHCGWRATLPRSCPTCGNQDLHAVGQGTQRIEETLRTLLPDARIGRIDRDSTRRRHAAAETFDAVHAGEIDVLVGTQMIAKGHDFRRVSLVGILNADAQLVAHDFRAPERLFATLVQVAGRAGRSGLASRVLVQTRMPDHPLFAALAKFDYEAFARAQLAERRAAGMPPYAFQALLGAEAKSMDDALAFLERARDLGRARAPSGLRLYEPVPRPLARLAGVDRGQLLIEANQRTILQRFLTDWLRALRVADSPKARWHIEVDPQEV